MSSFSSVVHKAGKKITPKAAPRRNVQRKHVRAEPSEPSATTDSAVAVSGNNATTSATSAVADNLENEHRPEQTSVQTVVTSPPHAPESTSIEDLPQISRLQEIGSTAPADLIPINTTGNGPEQSSPTESSEAIRGTATVIPPVASVKRTQLQSPKEKRRQKSAAAPSIAVSDERLDQSTLESVPDATLNHADQESREDVSHDVRRSTRSSKRQTMSNAVTANSSGSQNIPVTVPLPTDRRTPSARRSSNSQPPVDLIQSATQRAASVSELANSIELHTRSLLSPPLTSDAVREREVDTPGNPSQQLQRPQRRSRKKSAHEQAAEIVANVVDSSGRRSSKRALTPENAEDYELEPKRVKMGDLCEDNRMGKKSALETEMQANWAEILQRRKEDRERAAQSAEKHRKKAVGHSVGADIPEEPVAALAPAMTVVNGVIVVDQSSREIDRGAQLQQAIAENVNNIREDKDYYKYVNQGTVGMKPGHGSHMRWDTDTTELFFKALRMFGTDFLMIANMFPGATRKQMKMKFIREERADKAKVLECLRNRESVQLEDYAHMANKETEDFQTLDSIQKELEQQEKQLREEDNQRRRREGFVTNDDGVSDRPTNEDGDETVVGGPTESAEPGRFDSAAREIMEAAVAPKRRQRKANASNTKRGSKHGRHPEGGIEEVLGSITEVAV